jgi:hypothetical protein
MAFIKQLEFIALYLDIFTSVKSHDLNYKLFQHSIRKLCGLETKDIIFQQEFIGKESNYFWKRKRTFIPRDLTVNIQASCKLYKFDFCNCILSLSNLCYFIKV